MDLLVEEKSKARRKAFMADWTQDGSLPEGWSVRIPPNSIKKFFLSLDGSHLAGWRAAVLHMLEREAAAEDVEKMQERMVQEGWKRSEFLPEG